MEEDSIRSKQELAIALSKLKQITTVDRGLEQYQTDSELAAEIVWNAFMHEDIEGNIIYDLGCGNGVFGIGCLMTGARHCIFVDVHIGAIGYLEKNLEDNPVFKDMSKVIHENIKDIDFKIVQERLDIAESDEPENSRNIAIMNPPFGTKEEHADREFLEKAFTFADVIYSIHMASSLKFLEQFSEDNGYKVSKAWKYDFGSKKSHAKHKKNKLNVPIVCVRMEKK